MSGAGKIIKKNLFKKIESKKIRMNLIKKYFFIYFKNLGNKEVLFLEFYH
jgi:hypothetical protein